MVHVADLIANFKISPAPEADGYIMSIANSHDKLRTDIVVLDTADLAAGPVAIVELPFRLRNGIHGSWVEGKDLPEGGELCDMHGISAKVVAEFGSDSPGKGANSNGNNSSH